MALGSTKLTKVFQLVVLVSITGSVLSQKHFHGRSNASHAANFFLEKLFHKYGHEGFLTFEGFEHLLLSLGLGDFAIEDHDVHDHFINSSFVELHHTHNHSAKAEDSVEKKQSDTSRQKHGDHHHDHGGKDKTASPHHHEKRGHGHQTHKHSSNDAQRKSRKSHHRKKHKKRKLSQASPRHKRSTRNAGDSCLKPTEILNTLRPHVDDVISEDMFMKICPTIILQLDTHACSRQQPCLDVHEDLHCEKYHAHAHEEVHNKTINAGRNLFDIPAQVWGYAITSVLVISFVGMLGVAVVPLMQMVFYHHVIQFMVALAVGTLTGDAFLHLLPHAITGGHAHDDDTDHGGFSHVMPVMKGLVGLAGMYVFLLAEQMLGYVSDWKQKRKAKRAMYIKEMEYEQEMVALRLSEHTNQSEELIVMMNSLPKDSADAKTYRDTDIDRNGTEHISNGKSERDGHKHGHGHGHSHAVPSTIASAAWMVIMGDGFHNFTDGIAIGAAFAQSFSAGLSTSIAIFCHELPHELGDFAVLIKAGMSVKQAFVCNVVSSVLALFGMLIGVAVGNIDGVSLWIFALIAGLFIYIALVDMFPELKYSEEQGIGRCCHILLQNLGFLVGVGIMLTIALLEDKIKVPVEKT